MGEMAGAREEEGRTTEKKRKKKRQGKNIRKRRRRGGTEVVHGVEQASYERGKKGRTEGKMKSGKTEKVMEFDSDGDDETLGFVNVVRALGSGISLEQGSDSQHNILFDSHLLYVSLCVVHSTIA